MKIRLVLAALLLAVLGAAGYWAHQNALVPVPMGDGRERFVKAAPEFGQDEAKLEALMPAGKALEAFLAFQCDLPLIEAAPTGGWLGVLASDLQVSRHGRRARITLRTGWRMQDGALLDAARAGRILAPQIASMEGQLQVVDAAALDLRFKTRPEDLAASMAQWRIPGSGPFVRSGTTLVRFEGYPLGRAGIAGLSVVTDPAAMESRAWAEGLARARWAWAVFPGNVAPEDMAKVRLAPYDEIRMKDGSVWFLSRRLRRLRPRAEDWTRTPLFGAWQATMELPYDPLGM